MYYTHTYIYCAVNLNGKIQLNSSTKQSNLAHTTLSHWPLTNPVFFSATWYPAVSGNLYDCCYCSAGPFVPAHTHTRTAFGIWNLIIAHTTRFYSVEQLPTVAGAGILIFSRKQARLMLLLLLLPLFMSWHGICTNFPGVLFFTRRARLKNSLGF